MSYILKYKSKNYILKIPPKIYTFTINPTPASAVVTINGQVTNNIRVAEGTTIEWSVSLDGYSTQSGSLVLSEDTIIDVVLEEIKYYTLTINAHQLDGYDISTIYIWESEEGIKIYPDVIDTTSGVAIFKITREEGSKVTCYMKYEGLLGDTSVVSFTFTEDKTVDVTFIERP